MRPEWPKLVSLAQETFHIQVSVLRCILCFQMITFFKNIFDFTTAGDWDYGRTSPCPSL